MAYFAKQIITMVSVIIPNYNHSVFLKQRIDSILDQTYQNFELIILDDKSTDNSLEIIRQYSDNPHISYIIVNPENSGCVFSQWEKGFSLAKGEYIWIAESDDYAIPDFLECCVRELDSNPDCAFCYSDSYFVDENNNEVSLWIEQLRDSPAENNKIIFDGNDFIKERLIIKNGVYNASMVVFRKDCLDNITELFKSFRYCGDWVFWAEMAKNKKVIKITRYLNYFRHHKNNTSKKSAENYNDMRETIRVILHMKRLINADFRLNMYAIGYIYRYIRSIRHESPLIYNEIKSGFMRDYPYAYFASKYYKYRLKKQKS